MKENTEVAKEFKDAFEALSKEIGKVIVGHDEIVENVLICLFAGGNVLLEGVPGLGKTMLVRTLSEVLDLPFSRIQFTPDLMPADIVGTNLITEERQFKFQPGPIFSNIVLADEINRATPKTQSALLECMQEKSVTVGGTIHQLDRPFFVLGTQNPLEMEGTYPLPEAQLDRFLFKLLVSFPSREDLNEILLRTTEKVEVTPQKIAKQEDIKKWMEVVRDVYVAPHVRDYASRLLLATHPGSPYASEKTNRFVRFGSSPRGGQALIRSGKIKALIQGRYNVSFDDVAQSAIPALRHRMILNFEGEAERISTDSIVEDILAHVKRDEGSSKK